MASAFFSATIAHNGQGFADTASGFANHVLNVLTFMLRDVSSVIRAAVCACVIPCFASISLNSFWFLSLSNASILPLLWFFCVDLICDVFISQFFVYFEILRGVFRFRERICFAGVGVIPGWN